MRVFLSHLEYYNDDYGDLCDPLYFSSVHLSYKEAYEDGRQRIKKWKRRYVDESTEVGGCFIIIQKDMQNPELKIVWEHRLDGSLISRMVGSENGISYDIRPEDTVYSRGKKFSELSFVTVSEEHPQRLWMVLNQPSREVPVFENYYGLVGLTKQGYLVHDYVHENDLQIFTDDIPREYQVLHQIFAGETEISVKTLKIYFPQDFQPEGILAPIIERFPLADECTKTKGLLEILLWNGKLALPGATNWREVEREQSASKIQED